MRAQLGVLTPKNRGSQRHHRGALVFFRLPKAMAHLSAPAFGSEYTACAALVLAHWHATKAAALNSPRPPQKGLTALLLELLAAGRWT